MALAKKKQDEKNLQLLKTLVSLSFNKQCFDCGQKGPTYVDLTIGAFICMSCSGIVRGLNPPHRVKSITMSSFTDDEIEFIKCRGNYFCKEVWLGNFNENGRPAELHNDQNKKDFLCIKYERRQWYLEPSPALFSEAKQLTESALAELEQANTPAKSNRSYSGSAPILHNSSNGGGSSTSTPRTQGQQLPITTDFSNINFPQPQQQVYQAPPVQASPPIVQQQQQQRPQLVSLFDDDLETALKNQATLQTHSPAIQAAPPVVPAQAIPPVPDQRTNFPVSFSSMEPTPFTKAAQLAAAPPQAPPQQAPAAMPAQPTPPQQQQQPFKAADGFADFDSAFGRDRQSSAPPAPVIMAPPPDRYKALEDLDDLLTLTGSTGVISSGIDWSSTGITNSKPTVTNAMQRGAPHQPQQQQHHPQSFSQQPQPSSTTNGFGTSPFGPQQQQQQPFHVNSAGFTPSLQQQQPPFAADPFNTSHAYAAFGAPPPYSAATPFGHAPTGHPVPPQQQQQHMPQTQQFPAIFGGQQSAFPPQPTAAVAGGFDAFGMAPSAGMQPFGGQQSVGGFGAGGASFASNPFLAAQQMPASVGGGVGGSMMQQPQQVRSFSNNPFL